MSDQAYRVVVVGCKGIGKRALILRYINGKGRNSSRFDATVDDSYRKHVEIEEKRYVLDITNIMGEDISTDQYMKAANGVIIAYNITNYSSFEKLAVLRNYVYRTRGENYNVPIILVGLKSEEEEGRFVAKDEAQAIADKWETNFVEVSTKSTRSVNRLFNLLIQLMEEWQINNPPIVARTVKKGTCSLL